LIIGRGSGIRRAIRAQWPATQRLRSEQRAELQEHARSDLERVAELGDGNGRDG
jgi:hypothetical protein